MRHVHADPAHPDAGQALLPYVAAAFAAMGGEVMLTDGDETMVRARRPGDPGDAAWLVVAPGLPGLLHEFVHANQVGLLADDHGLDYSQIPYDLGDPRHRKILWDELAACVLSCAWVTEAEEEAWFAEQVGILGVFYGHDADPPAFFPIVEEVARRHAVDLHAVIAGAYAAIASRLAAAGAPPELAGPRARPTFEGLWARFRAKDAGKTAPGAAGGDIQSSLAGP